MFYVPKAIKAIFLSALIGSISVRQSHQFPWGFLLKCALPFLFIFTLQPATKGGSEPAYKWAGERPSDQASLAKGAGGWQAALAPPLCPQQRASAPVPALEWSRPDSRPRPGKTHGKGSAQALRTPDMPWEQLWGWVCFAHCCLIRTYSRAWRIMVPCQYLLNRSMKEGVMNKFLSD